ncbi:MAG TPA: RND transporter, partial [Noviherbaspirillum sp.]|nr:RND transporter [Noviherbaspirillum sp.]
MAYRTKNMKKILKKTVTPLLAAMILAGCAAPALQAPQVEIPSGYKEAAVEGRWKAAQPAEAQARGEGWKAFNDCTLDQLITDATAANA